MCVTSGTGKGLRFHSPYKLARSPTTVSMCANAGCTRGGPEAKSVCHSQVQLPAAPVSRGIQVAPCAEKGPHIRELFLILDRVLV